MAPACRWAGLRPRPRRPRTRIRCRHRRLNDGDGFDGVFGQDIADAASRFLAPGEALVRMPLATERRLRRSSNPDFLPVRLPLPGQRRRHPAAARVRSSSGRSASGNDW
ncbi:hypothetical protein B5180_24230 [Streptomyces sp. BF-3]|nr:hypothetical protein B5180_24230 [Streptomyces sp. BF-3]